MRAARLLLFVCALAPAILALTNGTARAQHDYAEIGWSQLPPIKLDVARLEIVKQYQPSNVRPHVDTAVPRSLLDSADRWARDRLRPVGTDGYARFIIGDAKIIETPLPVDTGITEAFKNPIAARYDGHLAVRLDIHRGHAVSGGVADGAVTGEATATRSTNKNANQDDISQQQYMLVSDAMTELNRALDDAIHQYLMPFIVP